MIKLTVTYPVGDTVLTCDTMSDAVEFLSKLHPESILGFRCEPVEAPVVAVTKVDIYTYPIPICV